ncbi:putative carbonic anhydrase-like protein 1 [Patella vulgata]|uniref:putative carbonic anhydrase-like protein 1 n=1 Tax=Patella vulgata TaxID=6465 RepID=UPI0021802641|nr:putative carbonic anhydrase-like protein 1 [Patella vulgata]
MEYLIYISLLDLLFCLVVGDSTLWSQWWSYDGISGPEYWGLLNHEWSLCSHGRYQSPVDITPKDLVYDPNLRPIRMDRRNVDGMLYNTGYDITFRLNMTSHSHFSFTGGPLSYTYSIYEIKLHFGSMDQLGSEHTVGGRPFPAEIQILGFNSDLYDTYSQAIMKPHGIAAMAMFGIIRDEENPDFEMLVQATKSTRFKDDHITIADFSLLGLIPPSEFYITYEGSLTQPNCMETVTWIIFNKPLYITKDQLYTLRQLHQAPEGSPQLLMENNFRPPLPINRRTIRTNITPKTDENNCGMKKITFYEVNERYRFG